MIGRAASLGLNEHDRSSFGPLVGAQVLRSSRFDDIGCGPGRPATDSLSDPPRSDPTGGPASPPADSRPRASDVVSRGLPTVRSMSSSPVAVQATFDEL